MWIWWWSVSNVLADQVGVVELVAGLAAGGLEADAERAQAVLALLGEQRDDQAGVEAAGQQHADRHVGDHPARHRDAQRVEHARPASPARTSRRGPGSRRKAGDQ